MEYEKSLVKTVKVLLMTYCWLYDGDSFKIFWYQNYYVGDVLLIFKTFSLQIEYLQIVTRINCHQHPSPKSVTDIYHQHRCCLIARKRKYLNTLVRNIKPSPIWYFAFSQTKLPRAISKPPPKLIYTKSSKKNIMKTLEIHT